MTIKAELRTRHSSMIGRSMTRVRDMSKINMPPEIRESMETISLQIFTDMANAGHSIQAAILAVYLSGLHHGSALTEEQP
jgi:hypothetical protein